MKDYYKILGLDPVASQDQINRLFGEIVKQYHPQVNQQAGARELFHNKIEAHYILAHSQKRDQYDAMYTSLFKVETYSNKVNLRPEVMKKNLANWAKQGREKGIMMGKSDHQSLLKNLPKFTWRDKLISLIFRKASKK